MTKQRLDLLLVERGLYPTRAQAQRAILAGHVLVNGQIADKPGAQVSSDVRGCQIAKRFPKRALRCYNCSR